MTQSVWYYVDISGVCHGFCADEKPSLPEGWTEVTSPPLAAVTFMPLEPAPFWHAALDLLNITQDGILASLAAGPEREAARIDMRDRRSYVRHDPMVDDLAARQQIPPEQMDSLWLYVQENYR